MSCLRRGSLRLQETDKRLPLAMATEQTEQAWRGQLCIQARRREWELPFRALPASVIDSCLQSPCLCPPRRQKGNWASRVFLSEPSRLRGQLVCGLLRSSSCCKVYY